MKYFKNVQAKNRISNLASQEFFWQSLGSQLCNVASFAADGTFSNRPWDVPKWLPGAENLVREKLALTDDAKKRFQFLLDKVKGDLVVLHARWSSNIKMDSREHFQTPALTFTNYLNTLSGKFTLYLASDVIKKALPHFKKWNPLSQLEVSNEDYRDRIMADYFMIQNADILILSNSSFSWASSLCNKRCQKFIRPDSANTLAEYLPWESSPYTNLQRHCVPKNVVMMKRTLE